MKKRHCMVFLILLLAWFFLDMTGVSFGGNCLVTRSYADDGIFFVLYLISLLWFIFREKTGKWVVTGWLSMWLLTQFFSHEWYTLFGSGFMGSLDDKFNNFSGTIHWLNIEGRYIPDVYHTILHLLLLSALIATVIYIIKSRKKQRESRLPD